MISPEAVKLYDIFRNAPKQVDMHLFHQRQAGEHAEDMTSEPEDVRRGHRGRRPVSDQDPDFRLLIIV